MKKLIPILIVLVLLIVSSCKKDNNNEDKNYYPFKSNWIYGEWILKKGYQLTRVNGDTCFTIQNNVKSIYSLDGSKSNESFNVKFSFNEDNYFVPLTGNRWVNTYKGKWYWMNSSQNKTHIYIPIFDSYLQVKNCKAYRLIKLSEQQLILEDVTGYSYYEFGRDSAIKNEGSYEVIKEVYPQTIMGKWKLLEAESYAAGHSWVKNDTLYSESNGESANPSIISKKKYSLTVSIDDLGYLHATETRGTQVIYLNDYWYWIDEKEPHKAMFFMIFPVSKDYSILEIKSIDQNNLLLKNSLIYYRFVRLNN